jgi:hypothetical protein
MSLKSRITGLKVKTGFNVKIGYKTPAKSTNKTKSAIGLYTGKAVQDCVSANSTQALNTIKEYLKLKKYNTRSDNSDVVDKMIQLLNAKGLAIDQKKTEEMFKVICSPLGECREKIVNLIAKWFNRAPVAETGQELRKLFAFGSDQLKNVAIASGENFHKTAGEALSINPNIFLSDEEYAFLDRVLRNQSKSSGNSVLRDNDSITLACKVQQGICYICTQPIYIYYIEIKRNTGEEEYIHIYGCDLDHLLVPGKGNIVLLHDDYGMTMDQIRKKPQTKIDKFIKNKNTLAQSSSDTLYKYGIKPTHTWCNLCKSEIGFIKVNYKTGEYGPDNEGINEFLTKSREWLEQGRGLSLNCENIFNVDSKESDIFTNPKNTTIKDNLTNEITRLCLLINGPQNKNCRILAISRMLLRFSTFGVDVLYKDDNPIKKKWMKRGGNYAKKIIGGVSHEILDSVGKIQEELMTTKEICLKPETTPDFGMVDIGEQNENNSRQHHRMEEEHFEEEHIKEELQENESIEESILKSVDEIENRVIVSVNKSTQAVKFFEGLKAFSSIPDEKIKEVYGKKKLKSLLYLKQHLLEKNILDEKRERENDIESVELTDSEKRQKKKRKLTQNIKPKEAWGENKTRKVKPYTSK